MGGCGSKSHAPKLMNEQIPGTKTPGFSGIYHQIGIKELTYEPFPGVHTVYDLYNNTIQNHAKRNAVGYITVHKKTDSQGKQIEERTVTNFTYQEIYNAGQNLGKALVARNLTFRESEYGMDFIGIYAKNRYEWFVTDWACVLFNITSVPLYDTLGVQNLTHCLVQTQMTTLFVSAETIKVLLKLKNLGNLKNVITYDLLDSETQKQLEQRELNLFQFESLLNEGAKIAEIKELKPKAKPNDCYTFSYTSGTTGPPKGAMLSHKNLLAFAKTMRTHSDFQVEPTDTYASYLPLPHVMQRFITGSLFAYGAHVTCTCGDILKLKDDFQVIKPTMLLSVPRLYNKIVDAVKAKFEAQSGIKKWLINKAVASKLENLQENGEYTSSFYDSVVFSKVRQGFGGKVRVMATGSAPISPQNHEYMMAIMCCPLIEGYGQTESSAGIMYSNTRDTTHGQFAQLAPTVEVKTCDIPEMKYTANDVVNGVPSPRGQCWVRGPHVFLGYYKQPEKTAEAITEDGWLKSGDVVQIMPQLNAFKIIDRKKNIFKLQQGEYVAPEKVEHVYTANPHEFLNASEIFLHGDSTKNHTVLITTPLKDNLMKFAKQNNFNGSYEEVIVDKSFRQCVLKELNSHGKKQGLHGFEMAKNIYFEPKQFLNKGILTNTMKLIRFEAKQYYKPQIDSMYEEGDIVGGGK